VRVLVAPDSFGDSLTAVEAATAIVQGWHRRAPTDVVEVCPLSDGGPGFLDVLASTGEFARHRIPARGPLGDPVTADLLLREGPDGVMTAFVETAQVTGLHLVPLARRDPGATTTAGVADLLAAARRYGARRVVLGLGGSATNDAGAGMLAALASDAELADTDRFVDRLSRGGQRLSEAHTGELTPLAVLRARWADIELRIASDVDSPLGGFHGASLGYAEQKGATAQQAEALERCLGTFATAATRAIGGSPRLSTEPGSGAAGGLGFGLMLLGGHRVAGTQEVIDAVGLADRIRRSDLVITGEGCFDWQSLRGKVVFGVARTAHPLQVPVIVIAGQVRVGRREMAAIGVDSAYPVARNVEEIAASMAAPQTRLSARTERVARTWLR
jgi:glycerate kinase